MGLYIANILVVNPQLPNEFSSTPDPRPAPSVAAPSPRMPTSAAAAAPRALVDPDGRRRRWAWDLGGLRAWGGEGKMVGVSMEK